MSADRKYRIAVIAGDGIGPEVVKEGLKVLDAVEETGVLRTERVEYDLGSSRYLRTGEVLPDRVLDELSSFDAIYFGAVGSPDVPEGLLERGLLLRLRFEFDLYVNYRPIRLYEGVVSPIRNLTADRCDLVVLRENTEGMYAGAGGFLYKNTEHEIATQESINTRRAVERLVRYGFELARERAGRVTMSHKTNVLPFAGDLWARVVALVGQSYPEVEHDYVHADAACLYLVTQPERFDVLVTDNLFGDILTDLGAAVQGGIGLAGSGNLNPERRYPSLFEPVHGSAPDIAGTGKADPVAAVLTLSLMLDFLGEPRVASAIEAAVASLLRDRAAREPAGTHQIGDRLAELARTELSGATRIR